MTVQQVHERVELAPAHVYVIPPGRVLTLRETERRVCLLDSEHLTDRDRIVLLPPTVTRYMSIILPSVIYKIKVFW
ncbi:MAG: hypothetical protein GVY25_09945 [Bacteroidetes bacterium]|jgi:chemotaxis response regulator CheB|nr:hypothetical protein [Bacteroidota bacterium]